jgi:ribose-phosphate pyrophosphokinase
MSKCAPILNEMSVIAGPASYDLACNIAERLGGDLISPEVKIFPDGESRLRFGNVKDRLCVIVQSMYPPTDRHFMQALMMISKCREDKAKGIVLVVPYLGYSRQDRSFLDGEVASMRVVGQLLEWCGTSMFLTTDVHSNAAISHFSIPAENISLISLMGNYAKSKLDLVDPLVVSPDIGGSGRALHLSEILNVQSVSLSKIRDRSTGEVIFSRQGEFRDRLTGRDVIIVDDIISSGTSVIKASSILLNLGARKIYVMCSHAVLVNNAAEKLEVSGVDEIIMTNSIPNKYAKIDISHSICESIQSVLSSNRFCIRS